MAALLTNDIYDLVEAVEDLENRFIDEEDPDTLAIGIYGSIASFGATLLQNSAITTGELGNELFPAKAKFERNLLNHAVIQNIETINAVPATIKAIFGIFEEDLERYMINDEFIIDKEIEFFIGEFPFHLEYDIRVKRTILANNKVSYTATYIIDRKNPLSKITDPYIQAPFSQKYASKNMIFFYIELMQITHTSIPKTVITNNLVENKTLTFSFTNQLADFYLIVTDKSETKYLTPVLEGMGLEEKLNDFCYYSYIDASRIRVRFDSISYIPKINSQIDIRIMTTMGSKGNFEFDKAIFPVIDSDRYKYKKLMTYLQFASNSSGGIDRLSIKELRKMLPKEALSRGSITCDQDLENYFNMINTEENRIIVQKRVDNQFERSKFAFMLLKDKFGNVVPTNTFDIIVDCDDFDTHDNRKYVLKPGCFILYDDIDNNKARVIKITDNNKQYMDELLANDRKNFVYTCPFMLVVTGDPLYVSYYMILADMQAQLDFTYINTYATVQFICTNVHLYRHYITDNDTYFIEFAVTPNCETDTQLITVDENNKVEELKLRAFLVFFNDGKENKPHAYVEAEFMDFYDNNSSAYKFQAKLKTQDVLDDDNRIYIQGITRAGDNKETATILLTPHIGVKIYICAQLDDEYGVFGRYDLDNIVPEGLDEWTVCNMYTVVNGLNLYENYSEIVSSQVVDIDVENEYTINQGFHIKRVPCIRKTYVELEECMDNFVENINIKKAYIDNALYILEDNFLIDFKFFNTYGPSRIYTLDRYGYEGKLIDRVNLTLNFEIRLLSTSDKNTKDYILRDIKDIIEDLNDISSLHIPNLITEITNKYQEAIEYIEFLGFDDYGPGVQHLYRQDYNVITGKKDVNMIPEFLTVHTELDMTPSINIRLA